MPDDEHNADPREQLRQRIDRHRQARDGSFTIPIVENEYADLDCLAVRVHFECEPTPDQVKMLDDYVAAFHLVGVRGAFGGYVHRAELEGVAMEGDEHVASLMFDLGSAPRAALDGFLRGLTSLWVNGVPIKHVVLGWTEEEAWPEDAS